MANILSVFKSIWHGVENVANFAEPFQAEIGAAPGFGPLADTILAGIRAAEHIVPVKGAGAAKKAAVTALVSAAAPGLSAQILSQVIDEYVKELNDMAATSAKLLPPKAH